MRAGEPLIGSFVKTPSHAVVEVMALAGFDFVVLDAEHAPFDRDALDRCLLAARAACLPALVRLCDREPATALDALDLGAAGVLAPHVCSVDDARRVHAACRYANGSRGFSNSPRAGDYGGIGMAELVARADDQTAVLCQIEDREAVERVEDIATFDGIDCLFIGRADLALSYGVFDPREREVD
ncbi:MAG TPA: aldolase/citrate lyase family protein, partial [Burkholderiaceae bacterium]|nr:aldolase/citrate lyase family protein [Burkholderiaceae bacterium]